MMTTVLPSPLLLSLHPFSPLNAP